MARVEVARPRATIGAKTYRFSAGIDEPEARNIIGLLESRHHFDSDAPST